MKNKVLIALTACVLYITPMVSSAYFTDANITEELNAQIASLLKQVQELQAKLAQMQGRQTTEWCHTFNTNLQIGNSGAEVQALFTALNKQGIINNTFEGLSGNQDQATFDEETASHVSTFQEKYRSEILTPAGLSSPTGYLGARTRAKLNSLFSCKATTPTPTPNQSLRVLSPNGGETWNLGNLLPITWKPAQDPSVSPITVSLIDENGNERMIGNTKYSINQDYYAWSIPNCTATNPCSSNFQISPGKYKIRIISPTSKDESDGYFTIADPTISTPTANAITSGLCPRISQAWGETFVDIDAGSIYVGGKNYVVNGSTGVTAGANKTVNMYAYIPDGQSVGYIGVADPNTTEASNFERTGILVAKVQSGSNPTASASSFGGVIQNIDSKAPKCPGYTRPEPTITLLSPNGGEEFVRGKMQSYPINWYDTGYYSVGNEEIVLMECTFSPCAEIGVIAYHTPGTKAGNTTFYWDASTLLSLPNGGLGQIVDTGKYKILIRSNSSRVSDISDSTFSIK